MAATEIASAYVALTVKAPGVKRDLESELGKVDAESQGRKVGKQYGSGISAGSAAIAGAIGGIFASLTTAAASAFGDVVGDAIAASDATDKFAQTLNFAGLDTSAIDGAMSAAQDYADATVYDLSTIQNTTAQLAANGITNYTELTEAAGNLNAVAGGNADTFSSVAMMLTQTAGAGKLTTENWNQLADAIPGASGRLQDALKSAGAYTGDFRDAMAKGEITADEFNTALLNLGTEPVAQEAAKSVTTFEGAAGNLEATINGGLAQAFTVLKPLITDMVNGLSVGMGSAFAVLQPMLMGFIDGLAWAGENMTLVLPILAGLGAALLTALAPAIWAAVVATWSFTTALLANPLTWIVLGIAALVAAIVALAMNWDTVTAWITEVWAGFISWITGVINGFVSWWNGVWGAVGQWISAVWSNIVSSVTGFFSALFASLKSIGAAISGWWNGMWSNIASFFSGIWNGILSVIRTVQTTFGNVFNAIAGIVRGAFEGVVGIVKSVINGIINAVNGAIGAINGVASVVGGAIGLNVSIPRIPRLADGATVLPRAGGTLAVLAEAGRAESVVDTGLMNRALEEGLNSSSGPEVLVIVDADGQLIGRMRVEGRTAAEQHGALVASGVRSRRRADG